MLASLPLLSTFVAVLTPLRGCFARQAAFENFVAIAHGWVLALGRGTLSSALVAGDLVGRKHWCAFYRLFSRAKWSTDELGLAVARAVVARFACDGIITLVVDDTLHAKGGKNVFGGGMHHDPLTSSAGNTRFQFGHCWVVLSIVVQLPFGIRPRALPVLFRLNVTPKMAGRWGVQHRRKTEQAVEMLALIAEAFPTRAIRVVGDNLYSCETVLSALPKNVRMVGRLTLDAELHAPLPADYRQKKGRPRIWGDAMPNPREIAENSDPWVDVRARLYGRDVTVKTKTVEAYWRSAGHQRRLRCVIVWRPRGKYPYEAFFSTDPELPVEQVLEAYACRWSTEVTFHETKDSLGAEHVQPWTKDAVLRTAPTGMLLYSLVVLWYADHGHGSEAAIWPHRPWYRHKETASFADMVATLRRATLQTTLSRKVGEPPLSRKPSTEIERWSAAVA